LQRCLLAAHDHVKADSGGQRLDGGEDGKGKERWDKEGEEGEAC